MNPANDNSFFTPQRLMRFGTALLFDFAKFIFGIILLLAPLIADSLLGAAAESKCNGALPNWTPGKEWVCSATNTAVTVGVSVAGYALVFGSGVGDVAVGFISQVFDDAIDFAAWILFAIWFMVSGVKFWGGSRATSRFLSAGVSAGAGLVPILNFFPTITAGVIAVEWNQYKEDLEKTQAPQQVKVARTAQIEEQRAQVAAARARRAAEAEYARQVAQAANDNEERQAANDNQKVRRAA